MDQKEKTGSDEKAKSRKRSLIEWGVILGVVAFLYFTGLHTEVLGTFQRGMLATGLIKPDIPELSSEFPEASTQFFFADEEGLVQSLAEYRGDVVFMNIWATWCPPCIAEMPSIQKLYDSVQDLENVTFLLVSMDEEFDKAIRFMENRNLDMPVYHFRNRAPGVYNSGLLPTTYVISSDGRLVLEKRGLAKYDTPEFEQFLRELAGD